MTTACPYCGSGDVLYDPGFRSGQCGCCGETFQVRDYDPDWELPFDVERVECSERKGKPFGRYFNKRGDHEVH